MTTTPWQPRRLLRVIQSYDTSMGTTYVKTDATFAYIKALGNRQGPHCLASELVASSLARWFGLTVPDFAILPLPTDAAFDLPRSARAQPGPAFVSHHTPGRTWGGEASELAALENPTDITRLVVFDTWVRNCDRHPPDLTTRKPNYANVYLADTDSPNRCRLLAIDHTHCFDSGRDFTHRLADIDKVQDPRTYGLFPAFRPYLDVGELAWCRSLLLSATREMVAGQVALIPAEWDVPARAAAALVDMICGRAAFVASMIAGGWPIGPAPSAH
jgi:hypothetical protein